MAQITTMKYRCYEWDTSCIMAEEFLNGLRNDFREKDLSAVDLRIYVADVMHEHIEEQDVLVNRQKLTAILGAMIASGLSDRPIIRKYAYDAVMNMWEYMDGIYLKVYMGLPTDKECNEFLRKKRFEFFQWYSYNTEYDASRFNNVLRKVIEITQYIFFEWMKYTCPVILMTYLTIEVEKTDRE